ncbi:MAG: hypothetical protein WB624_25465, partial [Xanthobacteraceae bacterium]
RAIQYIVAPVKSIASVIIGSSAYAAASLEGCTARAVVLRGSATAEHLRMTGNMLAKFMI